MPRNSTTKNLRALEHIRTGESSLTLGQLIRIANSGYPDGLIREAYRQHARSGVWHGVGDSLASFIAAELTSTFSEAGPKKRQLVIAMRTIGRALSELRGVERALAKRHNIECYGARAVRAADREARMRWRR